MRDYFAREMKGIDDSSNVLFRHAEFIDEGFFQFFQDVRRDKNRMTFQANPKQAATGAGCGVSGSNDIRVEKESDQTTLKTSSSVRKPFLRARGSTSFCISSNSWSARNRSSAVWTTFAFLAWVRLMYRSNRISVLAGIGIESVVIGVITFILCRFEN